MAARYRNNVSSKHYVHVRRKGCTGRTRVSRDGAGGKRKYCKNLHPSSFKMQSPCNTTCRYKGCMKKTILTMHDLPAHWSPPLYKPDWDAFHFLNGTWQNFAVCYKHSLNALMLPRCLSSRAESENLYTANWTGTRNNWPQQLCKLLSNIKIKNGDGLALL